MEKISRNERVCVMMKQLAENPNRVFTLNHFGSLFGSAKSSMSEDISILKNAVSKYGSGRIDTLPGAAGGVVYRPRTDRQESLSYIREVCNMLSGPERLLPGGFLYDTDILSTPDIVNRLGAIIASEYEDDLPDFVLTMETRGIPVAFAAANSLGVPLVIARHSSRVYEGSAVNINYMAGNGRIETMSLSRRAVKENQRALIVDDFVRDGGTAGGMVELMREFHVGVMGMAFVVGTLNPRKRISGEISLMTLEVTEGENPEAIVRPSAWLMDQE